MADPVAPAMRGSSSVPVLLRDRVALLSLAAAAGRSPFARIAALWATAAMLVPASVIALGVLVGRVVELGDDAGHVPASALTGPVVAVSVVFLAVLVVERLLLAARARLVKRVTADVDAVARAATAAAAPRHGARGGGSQLTANVALATAGGPVFGLASATDAELWVVAHYAGGLACAVLLARFSVLAAACALVASLGQRELLRRSFAVPYAAKAPLVTASDRAAQYWREVAAGPGAARELRVFGLGPWVVGASAGHEAASARSMTDMLARAVRRLWLTFVLMGVGAAVSFVVLGHAAAEGTLPLGDLVVAVGATLGVLRLGLLGEEAFALEAAPPRLDALRALERELPS